jgi:hypothetical protein
MELNTDLLRWILLIGAAPLWWPFLRALWRDFDDSLSEEGGVFGRAPGPRELERIRKRAAERPDPLISEPWARRDQPAKKAAHSDATAAPRRTRNGFGPRGKKRGFR